MSPSFRHRSAAAITEKSRAVAVVVSQSSGSVRIFQNGRVVLHITPLFTRRMVWHRFRLESDETAMAIRPG
jgi:hypothetical protein